MPSPQYIISLSVFAEHTMGERVNLYRASTLVDILNVRCYDFAPMYTAGRWHQSQLYGSPSDEIQSTSCHLIMSRLRRQGVPASKLVLGIPTSGIVYPNQKTKEGSCKFPLGDQDSPQRIPYRDLPPPEYQEDVDGPAGATFCLASDGRYISYDGPTSVMMKAELVKLNGLRGLSYSNSSDDASGPRSLIRSGWLALTTES